MAKKRLPKMRQYHVGIAAEAIAAAQFARLGYDVSVQYGANQPEYDLAVLLDHRALRISVKGSQDGGWGLTQSYLDKGKANYHEAIDRWRDKHNRRTVFCLVQFKDVQPEDMPRIYLATVGEIAKQLKKSAKGRGDTILHEKKTWGPRSQAAGTTDQLPNNWVLSKETIDRHMSMI